MIRDLAAIPTALCAVALCLYGVLL